MTWSQINEFIALEGKGSRYEKDLQKNTSIYSRLHDDLSEDAKDYAASDESLKEMYTILIQYLESCLKLVEIEEIKNAL